SGLAMKTCSMTSVPWGSPDGGAACSRSPMLRRVLGSVQNLLQSLERAFPKGAVPLHPSIHRLDRFRPHAADAPLPVDATLDQAGVREDSEVLRNRRLADREGFGDFTGGALPLAEETLDNGEAGGIGEGAENGGEGNLIHLGPAVI